MHVILTWATKSPINASFTYLDDLNGQPLLDWYGEFTERLHNISAFKKIFMEQFAFAVNTYF